MGRCIYLFSYFPGRSTAEIDDENFGSVGGCVVDVSELVKFFAAVFGAVDSVFFV